MSAIPVIAIDGPTASGKGTVASLVAEKLGFHYLDSGALYRLVALASEKHGIDVKNGPELGLLVPKLLISFKNSQIFLDDDEVTDAIRTESIGLRASALAVHPEVRSALVGLQRSFRQFPGLVADGRDMASVIFPDAVLKVFLTATAAARAERRYKQLIAKGISAKLSDLLQDLQERDARDSSRGTAPLLVADGAKVLETSDLSIDQAVKTVLDWYQSAIA
ncbi:(d)CMP kinase [Polynucleobacter asymbioticus]|uniref:Cytidylate kinase n=1 Tax=Polynucleobacter asymbioticus (strain DSM 18221 / CIP 109841 / QLW-P1DMWA-1) TaxID=312153 RepID=KCY_POLAQ|nr:(d)CMP kinase [Polynucleobacter asymbioticus]A4SW55.1 RecName: Full=Cytidylate kinase; Short=CK; AltName: Full=Cytidine monophosphate kinase; Short=CMP kinase [Polynucleobacter asymbioticus QLW-P1DMWA-1]ABP33719.1 cytidylate kinase [Polynucleobacter asymbioticus QLW-P1DMWA-1]APC05518.1 cytidylate kinase [Polynucleobacter asymbioticus]